MVNSDNYVGLDLSLSGTGFIQLDQDGNLIKQEVFKADKPIGDNWQADIKRLSDLVDRIYLSIPTMVRVICIEDLASNPKFMGSSIKLIMMRALFQAKIAKAFCLPSVTDVYWIKPSSVKKFVTTRGNANKIEVATALTKKYGIEFKDDNTADAFALAHMAIAFDYPEKYTKAQIECVDIYRVKELQ